MSWSTSELRVRLAPLNRFKPSSKIFYWPFQGGTSFVDLLCFCSVLCLLCLCARLFICALWSPAGKGLTSWLSFVVSSVSLSLSHWYPGSGVVLDCILVDSWSLHPYLLCMNSFTYNIWNIMRGSRKFCQSGPNSDKFVFLFVLFFREERGSKNHHKRALIGLPAKHHWNGVSLAGQ